MSLATVLFFQLATLSCNLKTWIQAFYSKHYRLRNNNQFSTPQKENAHRHSRQSCALILRKQPCTVNGVIFSCGLRSQL